MSYNYSFVAFIENNLENSFFFTLFQIGMQKSTHAFVGTLLTTRVDLHKPKMLILHFPTPKMLILQFSTSNVWKNANHTIFMQFQKTIERIFNIVSPAI